MRALLLETLYEWSKVPYQKYIKKDGAWNLSITDLLQYPETSLGFHLGCFLLKHSFEIQPKLESHDVYHVLTGTGISVPEEVSMQYYLWSNGKRSLYLYAVVVIGTLLYPDELRRFQKAFQRGRRALAFHQLNFLKLLDQPIQKLKTTFLIH